MSTTTDARGHRWVSVARRLSRAGTFPRPSLDLSAHHGPVLEEVADVGDTVAVQIFVLADPLAVLVVHPHIRSVPTDRLHLLPDQRAILEVADQVEATGPLGIVFPPRDLPVRIVRHEIGRPVAGGPLFHANELLVLEVVANGGPPGEIWILGLADAFSLREGHPHVGPAVAVPILLHPHELSGGEV